jgi:hypothetical protein
MGTRSPPQVEIFLRWRIEDGELKVDCWGWLLKIRPPGCGQNQVDTTDLNCKERKDYKKAVITSKERK